MSGWNSRVTPIFWSCKCDGALRNWSNIYNGDFFAKILNGFKLLTIFTKKLHRRCSNGLEIGIWLRVWNIELALVPSLQIKSRKYSAGKYVWHRFWKGRRSWWDSKQNECLCRSSRSRGFLEKVLWEFSQNSQENICAEISFLIKLNSVDLQLQHIGKVGPRTLRLDPWSRALGWYPMLGHSGAKSYHSYLWQLLVWRDPRVRLKWNSKARWTGTYENKLLKPHICKLCNPLLKKKRKKRIG